MYGQFLADRVGGRDSLSLAVAGSADTADHRVDIVSVALGILEAFHEEERRAFAHHKPVGAFGVGTGAGRGECTYFAEFHEYRRRHVGVDAAGDHRIEIALFEAFDRCR